MKLKILFFIENLHSGGKERRLVELVKELSKLNQYEIDIVLTRPGIHYTEVQDLDVRIHYVLRSRIKKDPSIFFRFLILARKIKPDVIHVWGNIVALYAIPTKLLLKIPLINGQVADAPEFVDNSILGKKSTFKFSDRIIGNSKAGLLAYKAPQEKSSLIYNGFNFERIKFLANKEQVIKKLNISTKYIIAMVGTFYFKKDYKTYIEAANQILNLRRDITFLAIGSGDYSEYLKMVPEKNKDNFIFLGKQEKVEDIMNICDIGVLATFTEGISNTLLEFMALEKPIVVTGAGGCAELISNNENGFLLSAGDVKGLVQKITLLLDNSELRMKFGKRSKQIVSDHFSIDNMVSSYIRVYNEFST